ncbi:hypothetical protein MKX03_021600, partial [Papaver bracteatum]
VCEFDVDDAEDSSETKEEVPIRAKAKGKSVVSKPSVKSSDKGVNPRKRRKITCTASSPTPLVSCSQGGEIPFLGESASTSPMAQLSLIFKDSFFVVGDDDLVCTCEKVSAICDALTLSHECLR